TNYITHPPKDALPLRARRRKDTASFFVDVRLGIAARASEEHHHEVLCLWIVDDRACGPKSDAGQRRIESFVRSGDVFDFCPRANEPGVGLSDAVGRRRPGRARQYANQRRAESGV